MEDIAANDINQELIGRQGVTIEGLLKVVEKYIVNTMEVFE